MSDIGEVRTVSSTGGEKGVKLARFDLIPTGPLWKIAEHLGVGAGKYEDRNWEKGYEWSKSYQSLQRHIVAWWGGEDNDPELGSSHLAAVAFHVLVLLEFLETHPEFDNRPTTVRRRVALGLSATEEDEDCCDPPAQPDLTPAGAILWAPSDIQTIPAGWEDVGFTTENPPPPAFSQLADLEVKGDLNIDGIRLAAGLVTGNPMSFERIDGDKVFRTYIPNPKVEAGEEPGSFRITPQPAPERPLAVGTPVIYLPYEAADPIEGRIETCERVITPAVRGEYTATEIPRVEEVVHYIYGVRYNHYENQLVDGITRDQLWLQA